ncbi:MAG TPA: sulfite exporter TauE/SafE family protein [Solirubrobacteraceae bacterium]|nr:sulfite exporter TauE/SafE family protein [Solirubrobacteraceae bacterium]
MSQLHAAATLGAGLAPAALSALHAVAILAAGVVAGAINAVVGSGTLFTFPVLLAFGYAPVVANVSNTIGLVPGSAAGAIGYRRELTGQRSRTLRLSAFSVAGGVVGGVLLLVLPASAFKTIVPAFIVIALALIVGQPWISRWLASRREPGHRREHAGPLAALAVFATGVYGGYFGAAQGILLLSILALSLDDDLQRINALKVVLAGLVNLVAGIIFAIAAHVAWVPALLIAAGSIVGGILGAHGGRRLPASALRVLVVAVGIFAIVRLLG